VERYDPPPLRVNDDDDESRAQSEDGKEEAHTTSDRAGSTAVTEYTRLPTGDLSGDRRRNDRLLQPVPTDGPLDPYQRN